MELDIEDEEIPRPQKTIRSTETPIRVLGKPVTFVRYGGLSPVVQKGYKKPKENPMMGTFHAPPAPKGVYAFVWPYIELFLVPRTVGVAHRKIERDKRKSLKQGAETYKLVDPKRFALRKKDPIWHHLLPSKKTGILQKKGAWIKTSYQDYCECLKEELHRCAKEAIFKNDGDNTQNWQKGHPLRNICKDHLEVFIERIK